MFQNKNFKLGQSYGENQDPIIFDELIASIENFVMNIDIDDTKIGGKGECFQRNGKQKIFNIDTYFENAPCVQIDIENKIKQLRENYGKIYGSEMSPLDEYREVVLENNKKNGGYFDINDFEVDTTLPQIDDYRDVILEDNILGGAECAPCFDINDFRW